MTARVTAYCLTGATRTGVQTQEGVIAVDPSVIPLYSTVYVEGLGTFTALDTGGGGEGGPRGLLDAELRRCDQLGLTGAGGDLVAVSNATPAPPLTYTAAADWLAELLERTDGRPHTLRPIDRLMLGEIVRLLRDALMQEPSETSQEPRTATEATTADPESRRGE